MRITYSYKCVQQYQDEREKVVHQKESGRRLLEREREREKLCRCKRGLEKDYKTIRGLVDSSSKTVLPEAAD